MTFKTYDPSRRRIWLWRNLAIPAITYFAGQTGILPLAVYVTACPKSAGFREEIAAVERRGQRRVDKSQRHIWQPDLFRALVSPDSWFGIAKQLIGRPRMGALVGVLDDVKSVTCTGTRAGYT